MGNDKNNAVHKVQPQFSPGLSKNGGKIVYREISDIIMFIIGDVKKSKIYKSKISSSN